MYATRLRKTSLKIGSGHFLGQHAILIRLALATALSLCPVQDRRPIFQQNGKARGGDG